MYAQCFVLVMVHMLAEYATAPKGGRVQNVIYQHTIVNQLIVPVEVNVLLVIVIAKLDGRDPNAMKVSFVSQRLYIVKC